MPTPTQEAVGKLIANAYSAGASDIHFVAGQVPRMRVDGILEHLGEVAFSSEELEAVAREHFDDADFERQAREGSAQRRVVFDTGLGEFRVFGRATLSRASGCFSIAVRLTTGSALVSLEDIGTPAVFEDLLVAPSGLIVVAGPHGSGKTTTLYAMAEWINRNRMVHLCTVEDPMHSEFEPKQALIQQREVGTDVPDVPGGISAALEQDLDVLMVAELSNLESLSAALHAAETGHLVLTQVHANTAEEALERIVEATPETMHPLVRRTLSQSLRGVSCQRLLPRAPRGRVAVYQVLLPDDGLRHAIATGEGDLTGFGAPGSSTMRESAEALYAAKTISEDTFAEFRDAT